MQRILKSSLLWLVSIGCVHNQLESETVTGNHDITLDQGFYSEHGKKFHNQDPQMSEACEELIRSYINITYLRHEYRELDIEVESAHFVRLRVFGSPYSPKKGLWAFGYAPEEGMSNEGMKHSTLWDYIPLTTDILISHTPPKGHCDESGGAALGCESLRRALWRIRPCLAVCGHVHEGRGVDRVLWDLSSLDSGYGEHATSHWDDPGLGNNKQSLINLSCKGKNEPLRNTGPLKLDIGCLTTVNRHADLLHYHDSTGQGSHRETPSAHSDVERLDDRMGRQETCIVNAAIMATSWPYRSSQKGARKYNKPIVIDLDLPIWSS